MNTSALIARARTLLARHGADDWEVEPGEFWCYVNPPGHQERLQGWKLHLSAIPLTAPIVLELVVGVLVSYRCSFKFAGTVDRVEELVSPRCDRGSSGKFLTAYPNDDDHFRRIAAELDQVTEGLPGPGILSDRPYRPGSVVHYRYGAFSGTTLLSNDGSYKTMLVAPDRTLVEDKRHPYFSPPAWAELPFPVDRPPKLDRPRPVLLSDRYVVRQAIRHANKGGVFRAQDVRDGTEVVIKQARPHVGASLEGKDVRDQLLHEADMLCRLECSGIAPRKIEVFVQDDNVFLVEELISGQSLRSWVGGKIQTLGETGHGLPVRTATEVARRLVDLVAVVHAEGLVIRDFTPNNVFVTDDDELRLIDLELLASPGQEVTRAYTLGYASPEQIGAPKWGPAPAVTADLYSLGATLFFTLTGIDPTLPEEQRAELLTLTGIRNPAARRMAPLVLGLLPDDAGKRWGLAQALSFLDAAARSGTHTSVGAPQLAASDRLAGDKQEQLLTDGLAFLLETMNPNKPKLWPVKGFGETSDPCNVQYGAGGVLAVLVQAARYRGDAALNAGIRTVADWVERRISRDSRQLPGLYFGRSGTAWALYEAARWLGDEGMASRAVAFAKQLPVLWPNPDIAHGAAGSGLAQLHLWHATGDEEFGARVHQCADALLQVAKRRDGGVFWPIPRDFDSELAGITHYGFAHGVAGIGTFLLAAGLATGRANYLEVAREAGKTLIDSADTEDKAAWWPSSPDKPDRMVYWCSGSAGVGAFLIRLWAATGEPRVLALAELAAAAVRGSKWYASPAACHGLAGNAEFLLDMSAAVRDARYREWAEELASGIYAWRTARGGRQVVPDESQREISAGYNTGLAGTLALLLRLRHGGPRLWLADALLTLPPPSEAPSMAGARP